ncbi:MAG: PaaI family thioesterase [bacterium]|nr:MAG: PaaI family thioesterase [bacterium]
MHNPQWEKPMDPDAPLPFTLASWVDLAPFERTLGIRIDEAAAGEAVLSMPFTVKLAQGKGLLHGGAITTLADTAAAMAIKTLLPENTHFATVEMTTSFLAPVRGGTVTARARAVPDPEEKRTYGGEVQVLDAGGTVVARFSSRFRVAKRRGGGQE